MSVSSRLRIVGVVCVVLGGIQVYFAGVAFAQIEDVYFGCWWAGLIICLTGLSTGMCATNLRRVSFAMGCSIFAVVIGFVGGILDAAAFSYLKELDTCTNDDKETFGDSNYYPLSNLCQLGNPEFDCVCVRGEDSECYGFDLNSGNDCDDVLVKTPRLLRSAFINAFVASLLMLVFSCMSCGSVCCPGQCGYPDPQEDKKPPMSTQEVTVVIPEAYPSSSQPCQNTATPSAPTNIA